MTYKDHNVAPIGIEPTMIYDLRQRPTQTSWRPASLRIGPTTSSKEDTTGIRTPGVPNRADELTQTVAPIGIEPIMYGTTYDS